MAFSAEDRKKARKGTAVSIAGGVVMGLFKILGFVLRAIFGGEAYGLYAIAYSIVELLAFFTVGGFNDTIVVFAARLVEAEEGGGEDGANSAIHYHKLATLIFFPFLVALLITGGLHLGVDWLYMTFWEQHDEALRSLLVRLSWCLPLFVLMQVPLEATKAHLEWRWPVMVVQVIFPALSLVATLVLHFVFDSGIQALVDGALLALAVCVPLSLYGYSRFFSIRATLRGALRGPFDREALAFAVPQSCNMMLSQGLVRIDSIMLSAFVSSNAVGVYSLVSDLTQAVRLAKLSVSGVFSPIVARYQAAKNHAGIQEAIHSFAKVTSAFAIPLLLIVMGSYEVWILDDSEQWTESRFFPWLLTAGPLMSCFFGLAGNTLLMTGHPRLLLGNAFAMGLMNLVLNWLFIPWWGLLGAALATAISNTSVSLLQIVELRVIERLRFALDLYIRTLLTAAIPIALIALTHQDAFVTWGAGIGLSTDTSRLSATVLAVLMYICMHLFLPGDSSLRGFLKVRERADRGA